MKPYSRRALSRAESVFNRSLFQARRVDGNDCSAAGTLLLDSAGVHESWPQNSRVSTFDFSFVWMIDWIIKDKSLLEPRDVACITLMTKTFLKETSAF